MNDGSQESEVRSQESEVRGQETAVSGQERVIPAQAGNPSFLVPRPSSIEASPCCRVCCFWRAHVKTPARGICRVNPPVAQIDKTTQPFSTLTVWPDTHGVDWCGRFVPKVQRTITEEAAAEFLADITRDLLLMVDVDVPVETIQSWTPRQVEQAEQWAAAVYTSASDLMGVRIPPRPSFLPTDGDCKLKNEE